jgi:hypothetical protein
MNTIWVTYHGAEKEISICRDWDPMTTMFHIITEVDAPVGRTWGLRRKKCAKDVSEMISWNSDGWDIEDECEVTLVESSNYINVWGYSKILEARNNDNV